MSELVGQRLKEERQARDISLEQVARATHIRLHYLQAIEEGDFDNLPSPVQQRGFLRAYAGYLNLDPEPLLTAQDNASPLPQDLQSVEPAPAEKPQTPTTGEAKTIFTDLGKQLQHQRDLLGLSLEDVSKHTHIRIHNLRALEAGELDELPSSVQARGMLNNYAAFLGLDPEPLLLRFADGLQAQLAGRQATRPRRSVKDRGRSGRSPLGRLVSADFILGGVLVLVLVFGVGWAALRVNAIRTGQEPSPTMVSIAEALFPAAGPTIEPTPEESAQPTELRQVGVPPPTAALEPESAGEPELEATEEESLPPESIGAVQVYVVVGQRAWMRVVVDGEIEFEGRVLKGGAYTFSGDEMIELLTGNGAGLQVFFNQRDLGQLGIYGEVVHQIFTPEGLTQPTPTITPTSTPGPPETPVPDTIGEP